MNRQVSDITYNKQEHTFRLVLTNNSWLLLIPYFIFTLLETAQGFTLLPNSEQMSCLGGKNPNNDNMRQHLFNQGPCAPVIFVPGFVATSLQVQIDCEILRDKSPDIFEACGWNSCNPSLFSFGKVPKPSYRLWVGEPLDKFTFLQSQQNKCTGKMLAFKDGHYSEPDGIKITWYGKSQAKDCGVKAVRDISGKINVIQHCQFDGFGKLIDKLDDMGYTNGVNYQAIPYDFRFSVLASDAPKHIARSIQELHRNTGKKVVIFGHSLGNIHVLKALASLNQTFKNQHIAEFVSVGAPFLGSSKAIKQVIAWEENYTKKILNIELGFGEYTQRKMTVNSGSLVNILPRTKLIEFRKSEWLQNLLKEKPGWLPNFDGILPKKLDQYLDDGVVAEVAGQKFSGTKEDMFKLFTALKSEKMLNSLKQGFQNDPDLFSLRKPDIPVSIIYSSQYPTPHRYTFSNCPTVSNCSQLPTLTHYLPGDDTVTAISNILTAAKWIGEENNGHVQLVEYGGSSEVVNEHYRSIKSSCSELDDQKCKHPCMHQDSNILEFLFERLRKAERVSKGRITHSRCQALD